MNFLLFKNADGTNKKEHMSVENCHDLQRNRDKESRVRAGAESQ